jgi:hypothetical protein
MDRCMRRVVSLIRDTVYPPTIGYLTISEIWCSLTPKYLKPNFIVLFLNYLNYPSSLSLYHCLYTEACNSNTQVFINILLD